MLSEVFATRHIRARPIPSSTLEDEDEAHLNGRPVELPYALYKSTGKTTMTMRTPETWGREEDAETRLYRMNKMRQQEHLELGYPSPWKTIKTPIKP